MSPGVPASRVRNPVIACLMVLSWTTAMHAQLTTKASSAGQALFTLSLTPASTTGGTAVTATITFAQRTGARVAITDMRPAAALSSTHPEIASVPGRVALDLKRSTVSFPITTAGVATPTTVTISASYGGQTQTATLTLAPPRLANLALNATSVAAGAQLGGTITLTGPAPAAGQRVRLTATAAAATAPAEMTVPGGATSAAFTATAKPVSAPTHGKIGAILGTDSRDATFTVQPVLLKSLDWLFPGDVASGNPVKFRVTLTGPAPSGGAAVTLSTTHPNELQLPGFALVPAGAVETVLSAASIPLPSTAHVTITATYANSSLAKQFALSTATLLGGYLTFPGCSLHSCQTTTQGGTAVQGTVRVYGSGFAPAGGIRIALTSDQPAVIVPNEVVIPPNANSVTFTADAKPVSSSVNAKLTATIAAGGMVGSSVQGNMRVLPPTLQSMTATQTSVSQQVGSIPVTLTLSGPAAPGDSIPLSWSSGAPITLPSKVPVPATGNTTTFTMTLQPVTATMSFTVSASYGGVTRTIQFTATP